MYNTVAEIDFQNPAFLFKYRVFDRNAMQSLIDQQIWLAARDSLNDPFDCTYQIDSEHSDEELLDHLNDCARARGEDPRFAIDDIPRERAFYEQALAELREGVSNAGIFCLSATPFEPLLWAH